MTPRINTARVLMGGLLAGVAIIAFNLAAQLVLRSRVQEEKNAWISRAVRSSFPCGPAL